LLYKGVPVAAAYFLIALCNPLALGERYADMMQSFGANYIASLLLMGALCMYGQDEVRGDVVQVT
jgi:hypothetical protein